MLMPILRHYADDADAIFARRLSLSVITLRCFISYLMMMSFSITIDIDYAADVSPCHDTATLYAIAAFADALRRRYFHYAMPLRYAMILSIFFSYADALLLMPIIFRCADYVSSAVAFHAFITPFSPLRRLPLRFCHAFDAAAAFFA